MFDGQRVEQMDEHKTGLQSQKFLKDNLILYASLKQTYLFHRNIPDPYAALCNGVVSHGVEL